MDLLQPHKVNVYNGKPVSFRQDKFDGYYCEAYKSKSIPNSGIAILYKKQNLNMWPKLRHHDVIRDQMERLPWETALRAELHGLSYHATTIPTLVNNAHPQLLLSPFAIEMWAGVGEPNTFLGQDRLLRNHGFTIPNSELYFNSRTILDEDAIKSLKLEAIEKRIEGFVVKDFPGGNAWKIKPEKTVDAFVVDYNISDSDSYAGGLKSVVVAVYDEDGKEVIIGTAGTGFDADYKMSVDLKTLIGRVGEFGFQSLGSQGKMKFPKFLRWRDDEKSARDCTINQILR